jgi:hypothetical protein
MADELPTTEKSSRTRPGARRRRLEAIAMAIMALGAAMMFQPFTLALYSYSFIVILAGTAMFIIVSHFRD